MSDAHTHIDKKEGSGEVQLNGYYLTRAWYDFVGENMDKVNPNHAALYFYCVDLCNRHGWKRNFGLPAAVAMAMTGIKSYNTYAKTLRDLVEFGAIRIVSKSRNQYTANIIALSNFDVAFDEASNKADNAATDTTNTVYINNKLESSKPIIDSIRNGETIVSHGAHELKIGDSDNFSLPGDIDTPSDKERPLNAKFDKNNSDMEPGKEKKKSCDQKEKKGSRFIKPTLEEVAAYCQERGNNIDPEYWMDYYTSVGWVLGKGKQMSDWKATVRAWEKNEFNNKPQDSVANKKMLGAISGTDKQYTSTIFLPGEEVIRKDFGTGTL